MGHHGQRSLQISVMQLGLAPHLVRGLMEDWEGFLDPVQTFAGQVVGNGNCKGSENETL